MIRRLFVRLFTRPCVACKTPVGPTTALCGDCVSHLPLTQMWAYREAHDERLRNPAGYRSELTQAVAWLDRNPRRQDAATTTTTKETP